MENEKELIIFCDESVASGKYYSNFYGGLVIGASNYERVTNRLNNVKAELNLFGEVKWAKVTERYLGKYEALISHFFQEVHDGNIKVRIMFSQNAHQPTSLRPEDHEFGYFKLYYQFIKHAFGLRYLKPASGYLNVRLYFDQFPDTKEKTEQFRGYLLGLNSNKEFSSNGITILRENITEVRSHEHVLLQCLDVVLGAIAFRLNDVHKEKPAGSTRRGKRTIAKDKLYKFILREMRLLRPNFNIGETTGTDGDIANRWSHHYRHWKFRSRKSEFMAERTKRRKKN